MKQLALDENTTVQALVGEGVDLLMRSRSKHPFGEK
ncbi:MAG: ribbon-helix-helix domain-containing protein [Caulobacteraceae bacterium]